MPLLPWVVRVVERAIELLPEHLKSPTGKKTYRNEHGLLWPTSRGERRRIRKPPRKWSTWLAQNKIVGATGAPVVWHSLRHTCASMLVSGSWGRRWTMQEVAELLGHSSVETTERYAHLAEGTITRAARETCSVPRAVPCLIESRRATVDSNHWPSAPEADQKEHANQQLAAEMAPVVAQAVDALRLAADGSPLALPRALAVCAAVAGLAAVFAGARKVG